MSVILFEVYRNIITTLNPLVIVAVDTHRFVC